MSNMIGNGTIFRINAIPAGTAGQVLARARRTTNGVMKWLAARTIGLIRAWRARREVAFLLTFNDRELKDLGLYRNDVLHALDLPLTSDPSARLAEWRRERHTGNSEHGRGS